MNRADLYKVTESSMGIQRLTLSHAKPKLAKFLIGIVILSIFTTWIPNILGCLMPHQIWNYFNIASKGIDMSMLPNIPLVVGLYALFFEGVFQVGKALYVMTFIRNREVEYESLFEGFMLYVKAFMVALIQTLIVAGWSLLFIIPGVIAKYGFSQSYFILADDPKKGVMQCLAESKLRMTGNKAMLFMLDLSYLPYLMLGAVPQVIAGAFIALDTTTIAGTIGLIILDIPMVLASGIVALGHGAFYELLLRHGFKNFKFANQGVFRSLGLNDDDDDTVEFDN